jgi:hypothetical protein
MRDRNRATQTKGQIQEKAREAIECRIEVGIRENIVGVYEELFDAIWDKITPTLGAMTVATIVKRAVQRTVEEHQLVGLLSVTEEGVSFTELKRVAGEKDQEALREGFKLLVANLFDILAKLTGNVLVNELLKVVEGKV